MIKTTIIRALEEGLATENRRVLSLWRAGVILRRATHRLPPAERRWERAPENEGEVQRILSRLVQRRELRALEEAAGLFVTTSPFVRQDPITEDEILMEAHPYASISHISALVFHGLTDQVPNEIHATIPAVTEGVLPLDTTSSDFVGAFPRGKPIKSIRGVPIRWHRLKRGSVALGTAVYRPRGYPVRVTDPEMSLLDSLQNPEWAGGWDNVMRAWSMAADLLDVERLVAHVEAYDLSILQQRVGWLLEELEIDHPALDQWASEAVRGGSSRLLASAPFSPTISERWKMSLNAPTEGLYR